MPAEAHSSPTAELIRLIDEALDLAKKLRADPKNPDRALLVTAINMLQNLRTEALTKALEPSRGVVTLGLVRGFADTCDDLNMPMLTALGAIERHYKSKMQGRQFSAASGFRTARFLNGSVRNEPADMKSATRV